MRITDVVYKCKKRGEILLAQVLFFIYQCVMRSFDHIEDHFNIYLIKNCRFIQNS